MLAKGTELNYDVVGIRSGNAPDVSFFAERRAPFKRERMKPC